VRLTHCLLSLFLVLISAVPPGIGNPSRLAEPDRVAVQHILISFKGAIPKPTVTRTREEAQKLAQELFERAKKGEDFNSLVKQFTDDEYPGIYRMSNIGITPDRGKEEYPRAGMVKAFGDVSFSLPVDGIGMAEYDPKESKYGWHIIKRIE
jgi:parvulin-like peptidyl-prolyl isomerase